MFKSLKTSGHLHMKKVSSSPKTNRSFPKKKKAVESGWGNIISILLSLGRILANGCSSLGCLGHLVCLDLLSTDLKPRSSRSVPRPCFIKYLLNNSKTLKYHLNKMVLYSSVV